MLVFLQEPASRSIWFRCKTLLLKLNDMVINLLYLRNIPHSGNGLPTPLESTMKRKPSQEFVTIEFEKFGSYASASIAALKGIVVGWPPRRFLRVGVHFLKTV
jgi:hypothetical protein